MDIFPIQFQQHGDDRGYLAVAETGKEIPFDVKRIYYIYGVSDGKRRGYHAHKNLQQIYLAIHGSCKVMLDDGNNKIVKKLNNPTEGLYIGHGVWREIYDFTNDAVLIVFASEHYSETDYIRNYDEFLNYIKDSIKK